MFNVNHFLNKKDKQAKGVEPFAYFYGYVWEYMVIVVNTIIKMLGRILTFLVD